MGCLSPVVERKCFGPGGQPAMEIEIRDRDHDRGLGAVEVRFG